MCGKFSSVRKTSVFVIFVRHFLIRFFLYIPKSSVSSSFSKQSSFENDTGSADTLFTLKDLQYLPLLVPTEQYRSAGIWSWTMRLRDLLRLNQVWWKLSACAQYFLRTLNQNHFDQVHKLLQSQHFNKIHRHEHDFYDRFLLSVEWASLSSGGVRNMSREWFDPNRRLQKK